MVRDFHPLVLFYMMSFFLMLGGFASGLYLVITKILGGALSGSTAVLCALFLILGFQSFGFAILFDLQTNEKLQP